jgi:hypothetical protein
VTVRTAFGIARIAVALLCIVALVGRFVWGLGSATFTAANFFAYLTIQSNFAFVVVSVLSGVVTFVVASDPRWLATIRATVLTCTVTSGVVFLLIVQQAGQRAVRIDMPWSDVLLHFVIPVIALADWFLAPGRRRAGWISLPLTIGYALLWGAGTFVRGFIVGWYPYYFLDPAQVDSPLELVLYGAIALSGFALVGTLIVGGSRWLADKRSQAGKGGRSEFVIRRLGERRRRVTSDYPDEDSFARERLEIEPTREG